MDQKRGQNRGAPGALNLDVLGDVLAGVEWPKGLVPAHPEARRLLEALGVVGLHEEHPVSIQELTETRICVTPLCGETAMKMSLHCRRHAPIAELSAERENGHQGALGEPGGSTTRELAKGAQHVLAGPGSPNAKKHSHNPWTREQIIAAIQRWAAEHDGRPPSSGKGPDSWQVKQGPEWPTTSTCAHLFGSWKAAIEAAGFTTRPRGGAVPGAGRKRQARAPKAREKQTASPAATEAVSPAVAAVVAESPEPVRAELWARTDELGTALEVVQEPGAVHSGSIPESNGGGFSLSLALTGDFIHDAIRVRKEASKLRAQAEALDVIAQGIDGLAETVA